MGKDRPRSAGAEKTGASMQFERTNQGSTARIAGVLPVVEALEMDALRIVTEPGRVVIVGDQIRGNDVFLRVEARSSYESFLGFGAALLRGPDDAPTFADHFLGWWGKFSQTLAEETPKNLSAPTTLVRVRFQVGRISHVGTEAELALFGFPLFSFLDVKPELDRPTHKVEIPLFPVARLTFGAGILPGFLENAQRVIEDVRSRYKP